MILKLLVVFYHSCLSKDLRSFQDSIRIQIGRPIRFDSKGRDWPIRKFLNPIGFQIIHYRPIQYSVILYII